MIIPKIHLKNVLLSVLSGLLVVGLWSPAFGRLTSPLSQSQTSTSTQFLVGEQLDANLQAAESSLLAQGFSSGSITSFVAIMSDSNIVPASPDTNATGVVGAALSGNQLSVRGSFRKLTSELRDYATDPLDPPNPNITSGFHIHRGMSTENGPFQYALTVMEDETGLAGSAMGDYTLTAEQLDALANGMLYVDLHTTTNRAGELRAVLMPI